MRRPGPGLERSFTEADAEQSTVVEQVKERKNVEILEDRIDDQDKNRGVGLWMAARKKRAIQGGRCTKT